MSEIAKRVELLREQMKAHQVDAYIVPTSDFHETEYVCDYFKARAFMSGFTGSAGTCVFTATEGKLWTDGRYFIQAPVFDSYRRKNERKAFEIGPNAHFYLDENVVWDLHFIIFFDICSMFLVNSISCPVEDGTAAPGNPVHPILYNRPDNRCPGNSPHSCSSMSPISDLV